MHAPTQPLSGRRWRVAARPPRPDAQGTPRLVCVQETGHGRLPWRVPLPVATAQTVTTRTPEAVADLRATAHAWGLWPSAPPPGGAASPTTSNRPSWPSAQPWSARCARSRTPVAHPPPLSRPAVSAMRPAPGPHVRPPPARPPRQHARRAPARPLGGPAARSAVGATALGRAAQRPAGRDGSQALRAAGALGQGGSGRRAASPRLSRPCPAW